MVYNYFVSFSSRYLLSRMSTEVGVCKYQLIDKKNTAMNYLFYNTTQPGMLSDIYDGVFLSGHSDTESDEIDYPDHSASEDEEIFEPPYMNDVSYYQFKPIGVFANHREQTDEGWYGDDVKRHNDKLVVDINNNYVHKTKVVPRYSNQAQSCSICLALCDPVCDVSNVFCSSSCGNIYHHKCIAQYIQTSKSDKCPICRSPSIFIPVRNHSTITDGS